MEDTIPIKTDGGSRQIVKNKTYAPATGLQSDFEKLLTTFVETKSVRYDEFAKIWRERKFSLICAGRQTDRETLEFMEECMKVAVKMFLPPYGFQARVGALYLLYGLYLTQPCLPKVKIRLTQEDWEHVQSMREELKKQSHHDTNFVLNKLLLDGAFYFCAISQEVRNRHSQADDSSKNMVEALKEDRQSIDDLFTEETMEQLGMIHKSYHQQKVRLAGPDASRPDRSLDVLHDKFPTSVRDHLQQHHERSRLQETARHGPRNRSLPPIPESGESDHVDSDPDFQPESSVGHRRARLKAMAYRGAKNKARYKHRALATQDSAAEETGSSSPRKKRGRPPGSKTLHSIQRATMDTISEEDIAVAMETNAVLHMPTFEELSTEGTKPGRKRKRVDKDGGDSVDKDGGDSVDKDGSDSVDKDSGDSVDKDGGDSVGKAKKGKAETSQASQSPAASSPRRKVGRPPKQQAGEAATPPQHRHKVSQAAGSKVSQAAGSKVSQAAGSKVSQAVGSKVSQAAGSPTKRRPGRPPKLKPKLAKQCGGELGGADREGGSGGPQREKGDPGGNASIVEMSDSTASAEVGSEPQPSTSGESLQSSHRQSEEGSAVVSKAAKKTGGGKGEGGQNEDCTSAGVCTEK